MRCGDCDWCDYEGDDRAGLHYARCDAPLPWWAKRISETSYAVTTASDPVICDAFKPHEPEPES